MSKRFITFAAGSTDYIAAGHRIIEQANSLQIFDKTTLYTDEYLRADTEFWTRHHEFIEKNKRGYGYWLWKPYVIKKTMEEMKDGDILLYLDSGCEFSLREKQYLLNCIRIVKDDYILGSLTSNGFEKHWNKMDTILKLEITDEKHLNSRQRQGGTSLFLVCEKTRALINEWYDLCCDYHLIDDSPSIAPNMPGFQENRHDQSIYSLLTKKYNLYSPINLIEKCIKAHRNKTGISRLI